MGLLANKEVAKTILVETEEVFAISIAIGELYYGAEKSTRPAENTSRINEFAAITTVLGCDTRPLVIMVRSKTCCVRWGSLYPKTISGSQPSLASTPSHCSPAPPFALRDALNLNVNLLSRLLPSIRVDFRVTCSEIIHHGRTPPAELVLRAGVASMIQFRLNSR